MARTTWTEWKPYLPTEEDERLYLEACLESPDARVIMTALGFIAEARRVSMTQLARDAGITRRSLYDALANRSKPRLETALKIANALGFQLTVKSRVREPETAPQD